MAIEEHYGQLLGICLPWEIRKVNFNLLEERVDIEIEYTDGFGSCSERQAISPRHLT